MKFQGSIRKSQAITTFGPGSIVDLRRDSVMPLGIDFWPDQGARELHEPALERLLGVQRFRSPPASEREDSRDIPAIRFPRWMICPECRRLAPVEDFVALLGNINDVRCSSCDGARPYPARFIMACGNGHIDDFPWSWWAHRGDPCEAPRLRLRNRGERSGLSDMIVGCVRCDNWRSLGGIYDRESLQAYGCTGHRPWLLDHEQGCNLVPRVLQRGASNVYFASLVGSLSLPPWSGIVYRALEPHWSALKYMSSEEDLRNYISGEKIDARTGYAVDEIIDAIRHRRRADEVSSSVELSEMRMNEYRALLKGSPRSHPGDEFVAESRELTGPLSDFVSSVTLVRRLREVRALAGFRRIDHPDPAAGVRRDLVPVTREESPFWLPAIEVRGEGVFVSLNESRVRDWEERSAVHARTGLITQRYVDMAEQRGTTPGREVTARFLLVHALAHAMIRQLSLVSGYHSASLRERIYALGPDESELVPDGMAAFLIYTSTSDSEGSLGGLVRMGEEGRLEETLIDAVSDAGWCSSDPLCMESQGQGYASLNLAACHSCMLLPETSCEEFNSFLDRGTIVGTPQDPGIGFLTERVP